MKRHLVFETLETRDCPSQSTIVELRSSAAGGLSADVVVKAVSPTGGIDDGYSNNLSIRDYINGTGVRFLQAAEPVSVIDYRTNSHGVVVSRDQPDLVINELSINLGDGSNVLDVANIHILGSLAVTTGKDVDRIVITDMTIDYSMSMWTGAGNDNVTVQASKINFSRTPGQSALIYTGTSNVADQSGADTVKIYGTRVKSTSSGLSTFEISLGGGNDTLTVYDNVDAAENLTCEGYFKVYGGGNSSNPDADILHQDMVNSTYFKLVANGFESVLP